MRLVDKVSKQSSKWTKLVDKASKWTKLVTAVTKASNRSNKSQNHSTQDSRVVPHRGTNWAALRLTSQIRRDAVLLESYGRGC